MLRLLFHGGEDLIFEVREQDSDRLHDVLNNAAKLGSLQDFFWFETVDGLSVALNLSAMQAVRFLWEPSEAHSDLKRGSGGFVIRLKGRQEALFIKHTEPVTLIQAQEIA